MKLAKYHFLCPNAASSFLDLELSLLLGCGQSYIVIFIHELVILEYKLFLLGWRSKS